MRIAVPLVLVLAGLVGLLVMGIARGGIPEVQVHEMLDGGPANREVKMHGILAKIHSNERPLRFTIADKEDAAKTIEVYCDRTRPDTFQETYDVAVQGRLEAGSNRFLADQIYTKCPSKYEAEEKLGIGSAAKAAGREPAPPPPSAVTP